MADYTHDMQLVVDPLNPENVVRDGAVWLYDPSDEAGITPIALKDPYGLPLPNPLTSNSYGFTRPFIATIPAVKWKSGSYTGFFYSYQGLRDEAVAAVSAAQDAATSAATAGQDAAVVASAALAEAVADAEAAQAAAASAAALVGAPADAAIATAINAGGSATKAALNAAYVGLVQAAKNPDLLIAGAVTLDGSDQVTSAVVAWPDGSPGTLTITSRDATGAVLAYNISYGSPVTKTFTQPTITRNANGAATNVPQIVVS